MTSTLPKKGQWFHLAPPVVVELGINQEALYRELAKKGSYNDAARS